MKSEFTEPAPNSKRQSQSDQTHSTFQPQRSQEKVTEPETYKDTKPNYSEKVIVMTTSEKENLQVTNVTQTVATHSHPAAEDQVRTISSDDRYTIADDSLQSAPDQKPTHQRQELSSSNQEAKVHLKSNRNTQVSVKPKKTKPTQRSFLPNAPQRTAFVIGKINDCPTKLLIDSGACISVINYEFVKEVLHDDTHPEMTTSTFPEVHTVSGEKLPNIGQIQGTLLLTGRQFPSQFHVIINMAYQAVLGRDFLQFNGAIINFLKLDKTYQLKMTIRKENSRAG